MFLVVAHHELLRVEADHSIKIHLLPVPLRAPLFCRDLHHLVLQGVPVYNEFVQELLVVGRGVLVPLWIPLPAGTPLCVILQLLPVDPVSVVSQVRVGAVESGDLVDDPVAVVHDRLLG